MRTLMKERLSASDYSKQQLLLSALELFAEHGIDAVSMRMVNRRAGAKNNSAMHYHFGDKSGLIEAVMAFIQDWFEDEREQALVEVEAAAKAGPISVRNVLEAWIIPYIKLMEEEWGYGAIRFIARIGFEGDKDTYELHTRFGAKAIKRFQKLVEQCFPETSKKLLMMKLHYCQTSIVYSLANNKTLGFSYMGDISCSLKELCDLYLDFNAAGMEGLSGV
jgi:AcrR family transcriptional regulator